MSEEPQAWQQLIVVGQLYADPKLHYRDDGACQCRYTLELAEDWVNQDGSPGSRTTYCEVVTYNKVAENNNKYLSKGRYVLIVGRPSARAYTDQSGDMRAIMVITAQSVQFLSGGQRQEHPGDDIPFG